MDQFENIRANAKMVIEQLRPLSKINFGYDKESVQWLQGYIERLRADASFESRKEKFVSVFGSFLGECIIHCYGGSWSHQNGNLCVAFDDQNAAFPFNKVKKQLDNGLEDGIASFFEAIPVLMKDSLPPAQKRWWKFW